jgi:hypothetical protein
MRYSTSEIKRYISLILYKETATVEGRTKEVETDITLINTCT